LRFKLWSALDKGLEYMTLPYFDLSGKTALVSGGATGLGLGISSGLAEAGARVVIASRRFELCQETAEELNRQTGAKTLAIGLDVTNPETCRQVTQEVEQSAGGIDILVNCAGVAGSEKPLLKMDEPDWDRVMDINLKGAYNLSRPVAEGMIQRGRGGRIINVASIAGQIAWPNMSAYCASKGGLIQLTKVMAQEWVRYGILVNAMLPGYFETPINTHFFNTEAGQDFIKKNIPMRRLGQVEEIKGLAILMASDAASFMSGSVLVVDGGHTSH
jgi:NAD(P)-dependent dehydrogenase (short-subunit alcohol dehydrogenase family)